uniref:Uncharacterized protein n=1 Tax=Rhizophora mucronata TaxID=61149 RepID=A0A2P2LAI7_RHIMU
MFRPLDLTRSPDSVPNSDLSLALAAMFLLLFLSSFFLYWSLCLSNSPHLLARSLSSKYFFFSHFLFCFRFSSLEREPNEGKTQSS